MSVKIVIGSQWGDEGKGKIIDLLSGDAYAVARYQGGANAGHTVIVNGIKYVLHLIPSGILHPGVKCYIGNGVVLDPVAFRDELNFLAEQKIDFADRIFIFPNVHIIMPYHKYLDKLSEGKDKKIGTTGRGIGPCYTDKYSRNGIRAIDFTDKEVLRKKINTNVSFKNIMIKNFYDAEGIDAEKIYNEIIEYREIILSHLLMDTAEFHKALSDKRNILLEGAQGVLLDVDHGTYPYVTSSNPTSGGAITGLGISPKLINEIIGVTKAYTTRVGEGPFPTELSDDTGERIRKNGWEFGATTGRPRRCGWLDLVALNYSKRLNGFDSLAMTKIDVLSDFEEIKICTEYEIDGRRTNEFPVTPEALGKVKPVYTKMKGWNSDIRKIRNYSELPENLKKYVEYIEMFTATKVSILSVGPDREETIIK